MYAWLILRQESRPFTTLGRKGTIPKGTKGQLATNNHDINYLENLGHLYSLQTKMKVTILGDNDKSPSPNHVSTFDR